MRLGEGGELGEFDVSRCKARGAWRDGWREYGISREAQGTTSFTVTVTATLGDPDVYISADGVLGDSARSEPIPLLASASTRWPDVVGGA